METTFTNLSSCLDLVSNNSKIRKTGFLAIDDAIGGFRAGELIVLASRPSMGKTSISMITVGDVAINQKLPVAVFSMKHDKEKYAQRLITKLVNHRQSTEKSAGSTERKNKLITEISTEIKSAQIYVDDSPSLSLKSLVRHCHELVLECGQLGLVVIDGFELMSPDPKCSDKVMNAISTSKKLRQLAKEMNCPVLITTILSRRLEHRKFKQPILSDLKLDGALSKYADRLLFLYRPQAYEYECQEPLKIIDGKCRSKFLSVEIDDFISKPLTR